MKVTLFLMSKKGLESLRMIIKSFGSKIIDHVYTRKDTGVLDDYFLDITQLCAQHNIDWSSGDVLYEVKTKLAIAISWRWMITTDKTLIVLHDSLLPQYKGWAPLVTALINEEERVGVSAFIAQEGECDSGDLVEQESIQLSYPIKIERAIDLIIPAYVKICYNILSGGELKPIPQPKQGGTYSMWLDTEDYQVDWNDSAHNIVNFINAVGFPYGGAGSTVPPYGVVKIQDAEVFPDATIMGRERHIGKVFTTSDNKYVVVAGEGMVKLNKVVISNGEELPMEKFRLRFK